MRYASIEGGKENVDNANILLNENRVVYETRMNAKNL